MASITQNKKDGKIVSYKFRACVGRDEFGKHIFYCSTWKAPEGMTPLINQKRVKMGGIVTKKIPTILYHGAMSLAKYPHFPNLFRPLANSYEERPIHIKNQLHCTLELLASGKIHRQVKNVSGISKNELSEQNNRESRIIRITFHHSFYLILHCFI